MKKLLIIGVVIAMIGVQSSFADTNLDNAIPNNESEFGPEFLQALNFAYETGLTKFKTVNDFKPYDKISREQTASMMGKFAHSILKFDLDTSRDCMFEDIEDVDNTLYTKIMMSCHTGLFHGTKDGFLFPKKDLSKAEGITVLMRMFKGEMNEEVEPRYKNYYEEAKKIGLTKEPKVESLERPMTRYETILLLYRFNVKYNLLNMANGGSESDGINFGINMISDDIVYINSKAFLNDEIDEIHAQIYGVDYRLEKANLISQFASAFTRYGNVFTKVTDENGFIEEEYVGVATFNLVNEIMIDGNIRPIELGDNYYKLSLSELKPFYEIEEVIVTKSENDLEATLTTRKTTGELQNKEGETLNNAG